MSKYLLLWSCSQIAVLKSQREKNTELKLANTFGREFSSKISPGVYKEIPAWCYIEHGCWETWPSRAPPTAAALAQTAVKNINKGMKCFICINLLKFLAKKLVRFWCGICLSSPWIRSSRAEQKQTGWWERPPDPLWQLSMTCVWTPVYFHEPPWMPGCCYHHSGCMNWIEDWYQVWWEFVHQFLSVLFLCSFSV